MGSLGFDINDAGLVAGGSLRWAGVRLVAGQGDGTTRAGETAGSFQDLGSALGVQGIAHTINASGAVVGEATVDAQPLAFVWTAGDGFTSLGRFQGMKLAVATDINDHGWIVGFAEGATGGSHAMLWKVK